MSFPVADPLREVKRGGLPQVKASGPHGNPLKRALVIARIALPKLLFAGAAMQVGLFCSSVHGIMNLDMMAHRAIQVSMCHWQVTF